MTSNGSACEAACNQLQLETIMVKAVIKMADDGTFYGITTYCPGCVYMGGAPMPTTLPVNWLPPGATESPYQKGKPHWDFNGDFDKPTFSPSINSWWGGDNGIPLHRCHSFVRDGKIQFLGDCTHSLANQTVDLADVPGLNPWDVKP
jgi:hypothetical protein